MIKTLAFFLIGVALLGGLLLLSNSDYLPGKQAEFQKAAQPIAERALAALKAQDLTPLSAQEQSIVRDISGRLAASKSMPRTSTLHMYRYKMSFDAGARQSAYFMTTLEIDKTANTLHFQIDDVGQGPQLVQAWIEGQAR